MVPGIGSFSLNPLPVISPHPLPAWLFVVRLPAIESNRNGVGHQENRIAGFCLKAG